MFLAQAEVAVIEKAMQELAKQQSTTSSGMIYIFLLALLIVGAAMFYAFRFILTHTSDIHRQSSATISGLSETFSSECKAMREQHHKDLFMARDMVHASRDVAQTSVTQKQYIEELLRRDKEIKAHHQPETP